MRKITVPPAARELSTLPQIDFADAYLVDVDPTGRSAEQWGRAIFDDAPQSRRLELWSGWMSLGLRLAPMSSREHILGWEIRRNTPTVLLVGADSRTGMPAEMLVSHHDGALLFDTFVQTSTPVARATWAVTQHVHERVLPAVLREFRGRVQA